MKLVFQLFANFFAGLLGKLLIVANFVICLFIFDWSKFFRYLETPARINCHIKPFSRGIDFCVYGLYYSPIESFFLLIATSISVLFLPSILVTELILGDLKKLYPLWCVETFDILYIPIFAGINSFYCLFLGDMIEKAHSAYLRNKPVQKPLSIFSGFD
jgi:hypothetical protein